MSYIRQKIKEKEKELDLIRDLKEKALNGATGFDILYEVEQNYALVYLFDKFEKSVLKDLGENRILSDSLRSLGNEVLKALNSQIHTIEQEIHFLKYKLDKLSS
jgi:hypothetical protein